jgi:hypothetical protein
MAIFPLTSSLTDGNLSTTALPCSPLLSLTVIRSNLSPPPTFPATFWDLVPFLCAGGLALIFTALLVLLVEDDSNDSKLLGEQQSQRTSYQRRFVGLNGKEREWTMRSQSSGYGYSLVWRNVTDFPASIPATAQTSRHQRQVFPKRSCGSYPPHLFPIPHLIHAPFDRPSR